MIGAGIDPHQDDAVVDNDLRIALVVLDAGSSERQGGGTARASRCSRRPAAPFAQGASS